MTLFGPDGLFNKGVIALEDTLDVMSMPFRSGEVGYQMQRYEQQTNAGNADAAAYHLQQFEKLRTRQNWGYGIWGGFLLVGVVYSYRRYKRSRR